MNFMYNIIALTGYANSGKDHLCQKLIEKDPSFNRYALADYLKELMCIILDKSIDEMNEWKNESTLNRQRLIDFSEKGVKQVDREFWVKKFYMDFKKQPKNYIITDIRYYDEYYYLLRKFSWGHDNVNLKFVYVENQFQDVYTKCGNEIKSKDCSFIYKNYKDENVQHVEQTDKLISFIYESASKVSSAEQG